MKPLFPCLLFLAICFFAPRAGAFNPPEDKAGPLTVRIEGPAKVTATDTPVPMRVALENDGDQPLEGTLRLEVIDHWRVEPSEPQAFSVPGKGTSRIEFTVVAGEGTYNALYPVHAFAEFETGGVRHVAHPVLIVKTQVDNAPRPQAVVEWQPLEVPPNRALSLVNAPVFRTVIQVFGEKPVVLPPGQRGTDGRTRCTVNPGVTAHRPDGRIGVDIHPPWYGGLAGTALIEYPLRLPEDVPIELRFANALGPITADEPPSDGVTFRVRALPFDAPDGELGEALFERHTDAETWQEGQADLSRFAGQSIRLQLESHPGPGKDTTCDRSFWAEPVLTAGTTGTPSPPKPAAWKLLDPIANDVLWYDVRVQLGERGLLDSEVAFVGDGKRASFRGFRVRVSGDALDAANCFSTLLDVVDEPFDHGIRVRHCFESWAGTFELVGELYVEDERALRAKFWLENAPAPRPWSVVYIEDLSVGPWNDKAIQVYAGAGNVLRNPDAFDLGFEGHRLSTSFVGFDFAGGLSLVQAVNVPPSKLEVAPDARIYTLHTPLAQTMTFIPSHNVWEAVRVWRDINGLEPAGGVQKLAGRFVFDLWGGYYASSARALEEAFRYGLTNSAVVWHNWQRWGYDYRLPDIYPPNPALGTLEEFQDLARVCKDHGVIFAPHDNYIDFYPDAEGFSYERIAFSPNGRPVMAWLNTGRDAQSYRWRTDALRPFLERNVKLIRESIAPNGYFIDVWSSIGPYESWTCDARLIDRVVTRNTWAEAFAWIRDYLGDNAPQISESGHDQLIGSLDGAQTNHLRVGEPLKGSEWMVWDIGCEDAERTPWFDAAHHDRFILHGAGYDPRYRGGLDAGMHGIYSDDYVCTEVLTGHPAMVSQPFGRNVVRKYWLLNDLMETLALERIASVEYAGNDLHRQHVRWENGGDVWVNRGESDWAVADHTLPQYGFYARAGDVEAAIERRDGLIVEWSSAPDALYVNARPVISDKLPVKVALDSIECLGERGFRLTLRWDAGRPLEEALNVFVHFVDEEGAILFQADHEPETPTTEWEGVVRTTGEGEIPNESKPGDAVELRVGLWRSGPGRRTLEGLSDGEQRIRLGTVRLEGKGEDIEHMTSAPIAAEPDPALVRLNAEGKAVSFGNVSTVGACRITPEEGGLLITPLPKSRQFSVCLKAAQLPCEAPQPKLAQALNEDSAVLKSTPLHKEGDIITLTCEPGVFAYRLTGG